MTAYQLAIKLDTRYPEVKAALNVTVGGAGTGERRSLAQYLARELSGRIKREPDHPVEGAFVSNEAVRELVYEDADGQRVTSSLTARTCPPAKTAGLAPGPPRTTPRSLTRRRIPRG